MAAKLAIVLPGGGYTPLGPAIRIPVLALQQLGYTVRDVTYPDVPGGSEQFDWDSFSAAAAGPISEAAAGDWTKTVVVAKSLGTGVLARVGADLRLPNPRAIWLTPLFESQPTRDGAIALGWPSLIVAGTADRYHDAAGFELVATALQAQIQLIDGADHGLEVPGDVTGTVAGLARLAEATLDFAS